MSEPFGSSEASITRALPSSQDNARNRMDLHFAIREYEYALALYQNLLSVFTVLYTEEMPELPHEQLKQKIGCDLLLAQEALQGLSRRGDVLVALARKLEEYIPSGKIVV
jgi:hypothetical protein